LRHYVKVAGCRTVVVQFHRLDCLLLCELLRAWYEAYGKDWVRLSTIPGGQRSALLLSHDVDWENSFAPGLDFARIEKANQASSTFFIQTKYVDDANSKAFFLAPNLDILRQLEAGGSTVGSHSIIHSRGFNKFELGSGHETYSSYQPRGLGFDPAMMRMRDSFSRIESASTTQI